MRALAKLPLFFPLVVSLGVTGCASSTDSTRFAFSVRTNTEAHIVVEKIVSNLPTKFGSSTRNDPVGTQQTRDQVARFTVILSPDEVARGTLLRVTASAPGFVEAQQNISVSGVEGEVSLLLAEAR